MQPQDLIKGTIRLISLPEIFIKINEMVDDPASSSSDIGKLISQDPALTARLLKIANSPLYGFPSKIDTVSRSITIIGIRGIRDLVLASSTIEVLSKFSSEFIEMQYYWKHSICCAVYARLLAIQCNALHIEPYFVAGLLHDIGKLIILRKLPEMARESHLRADDSGLPLSQVEQEVIGFDHASVGAELLRFWRLPETILDAVTYHHQPGQAQESPMSAAIVHIANSIAMAKHPMILREGQQSTTAGSSPVVDPAAWTITGLTDDVLDTIQEEAELQFNAMQQVLLGKAA